MKIPTLGAASLLICCVLNPATAQIPIVDSQYAREATPLLASGRVIEAVEVYERAFSETGNLEFLLHAGQLLLRTSGFGIDPESCM